MHLPRFLEWVGALEYTRLLSRAPSEWIRSMTWVQTLDSARQLQRNTCLMTSNLSVLDQNGIWLHGMASEMLQLVVGRHEFPSAVMDTAAPVPRVCRASVHMEAMGLWHPPHGVGLLRTHIKSNQIKLYLQHHHNIHNIIVHSFQLSYEYIK